MNIDQALRIPSGAPMQPRNLRIFLLALAVAPHCAQAQTPEPPPAAAASAPAAPPVAYGRNYTIDAGLVVVLFGAAVFAVCRTSQRV